MSDQVADGGYYDPTFTFDSITVPAPPAAGGSQLALTTPNPTNGGIAAQIPIGVVDTYAGDVPGSWSQ
ncbi:MAG: hypothetical protein JO001_21605 [Alphaproteobacteria bacterium]|nr:hypothetical protein [Alphaproteobacteria bacterium]